MIRARERCIYLCLNLMLAMLFLTACNYPGLIAPTSDSGANELRETLDAITTKPTPTVDDLSTTPASNPVSEIAATAMSGSLTPPLLVTQPFDGKTYHYISQAGDTKAVLAARFKVDATMLRSSVDLPENALIIPGTEIWIPAASKEIKYSERGLPDCEVINSPTVFDFDIDGYIDQQGGYLSRHSEWSQSGTLNAKQIISRVSIESSVNPRLLLTLIEMRAGWVTNPTSAGIDKKYPLGFHVSGSEGLYKELLIAATHMNMGYYGWRNGSLVELKFRDGTSAVPDPRQNAGTIGILNMLGRLYDQDQASAAVYGDNGFIQTYYRLFGDPWAQPLDRMQIFPPEIVQPELALPFNPGERWSLTGGPHPSWKTGSPRGALDFAPVTGEPACSVSRVWVTAPASGMIVRSDRNVVALDLDSDGFEQTGWVIIFMHIADMDRVAVGAHLKTDDRIGHPSCEGGVSTGTHFHITRKYNGEWLAVEAPLPFIMDGWQAYADEANYKGGMIRGEQEVVASPVGPRTSIVVRE